MKTFPVLARWVGMVVALAIMAAVVGVFPLRTHATESTVTSTTLLSAVSALNTAATVTVTAPAVCRETAIYVQWSAGTSAGAVKVESADDASYAGTWAPLATDTWTAVSSEDIIQITGVHRALRTRISTAIVGGTVSTFAVCN